MASLESISETSFSSYSTRISCTLPSRKASLLAAQFYIAICSILTLTKCSFMIENTLDSSYSMDNVEVGLFSRSVYDADSGRKLGCVRYTDKNEFDSFFRAGRTFGTFTALFACTSVFFSAIVLFFLPRQSRIMWSAGQYSLMASTLTQMFTFFALGSDYLCQQADCKLTGVGALSAINVIVLGIVSIVQFLEICPDSCWFTWWECYYEHRQTSPVNLDRNVEEFLQTNRPVQLSYDATGLGASKKEIDPYTFSRAATTVSVHSNLSQESTTSTLGLQTLHCFRIFVHSLFVLSWMLAVLGVQQCTFLLVGPAQGSQEHFSGIGLFSRAVYYRGDVIGCIDYPEATRADFDSPFQTGRVFGVITTFLMTFICLLNMMQVFVGTAKDEVWLLIRLLLPFATLSQMLTFLVYNTETCTMHDLIDCVPGRMGIWVILNILLMTFLSMIVLCVPAPPTPLLRRAEVYRPEDSSTLDSIGGPNMDVFHSKHSVLESKSIHMVQQEQQRGHSAAPARVEECDDDTTNDDSYYNTASHAASERIVRIQPLRQQAYHHPASKEAAMITVSVEYVGKEKRTVKTLTHPDGSQTITTTIEEISVDDNDDEDYDDETQTGCGSVYYESEEDDSGARSEEDLEDVRLDEDVIRLAQNYSQTSQKKRSNNNVHRPPTPQPPTPTATATTNTFPPKPAMPNTTIHLPDNPLSSEDLTPSSLEDQPSFIPVNTSDDLD